MKLDSARSLKAEILSPGGAFRASLETASAIPSVAVRRAAVRRDLIASMAIGVAPSGEARDFRLAVRLLRTGPPTEKLVDDIRTRAKGEVDLRVVGSITKLALRPGRTSGRRRPVEIGSSIGDRPPRGSVNAGTLGCFVAGREAPHHLSLLTNNHVIAGENLRRRGSEIVQPGTLDGGRFPDDVIGELGRFVSLRTDRANFVDAALGDLYEDVEFDPRTLGTSGELRGVGHVHRLPHRARVHKVGRTTSESVGRVTAFDLDNVRVNYDRGVFRFDEQIEIEGEGRSPFSRGGDSGSLIVSEAMDAVGLLFAGSSSGGSNGEGLTYANPIGAVLDALEVDLEA